jgi:hypothetical protein
MLGAIPNAHWLSIFVNLLYAVELHWNVTIAYRLLVFVFLGQILYFHGWDVALRAALSDTRKLWERSPRQNSK